MGDTVKEFARRDLLIIVVGIFVLLFVGAGILVADKLVGSKLNGVQGKVTDLQNKILVMDTTNSQSQNNVVIKNTGCDPAIKSQNDRDMVTYLANAISFTDGAGYNTVRTNLLTSLTEREVAMIMPPNVQLSDTMWQSDADKLSVSMDGFKSYCIDCSNGYTYFATVTLQLMSKDNLVNQQRYMMTYNMTQEGNVSDFKMYAIMLGSN